MTIEEKDSIKRMLNQAKKLINNIESKLNNATMGSVGTPHNSKEKELKFRIKEDFANRVARNISKTK